MEGGLWRHPRVSSDPVFVRLASGFPRRVEHVGAAGLRGSNNLGNTLAEWRVMCPCLRKQQSRPLGLPKYPDPASPHSGVSGLPGENRPYWIPAFAGMTPKVSPVAWREPNCFIRLKCYQLKLETETPVFGHNLLQNKELFAFPRRINPFGLRGPSRGFSCWFLPRLGSLIYRLTHLVFPRRSGELLRLAKWDLITIVKRYGRCDE